MFGRWQTYFLIVFHSIFMNICQKSITYSLIYDKFIKANEGHYLEEAAD